MSKTHFRLRHGFRAHGFGQRILIDLLVAVFPLRGFHGNIGVIVMWFNCLYYFILFLSEVLLHVIF